MMLCVCNIQIIAASAICQIDHKAEMANIAQGKLSTNISNEAKCFTLRMAHGRTII